MNTQPNNPTFENYDLTPLRDLPLAQWLRLADSHPETVPGFKKLAYSKFSGYELESVLHKLDQCAAVPGLGLLWSKVLRPNNPEAVAKSVPFEEPWQSNTIAGDPELARLAVALKQSPQCRLWLIVLQIVRQTNVNHVLRADLAAALSQHGISVSERSLRRWLYRGHNLFWDLTESHVYFVGQVEVARRLVEMAVKHDLTNLYATNRPGKRNMYIDVSGSLQQFEANVYAAWCASRENPTIARSTLTALWNREPRILRKWEKLAGVDAITNEAQYAPDYFAEVPEHAYMYQAAVGQGSTETRFRARMANTYHAPSIKQHSKRGQSRRVFFAVTKYLESIEPAGNCEQDQFGATKLVGGLKPTGRRYFETCTKARNSAKRLGDRERYILLGEDSHQRVIFDYAPDGRQRTVKGEELPLITQRHFTPSPVYAKDVIYA